MKFNESHNQNEIEIGKKKLPENDENRLESDGTLEKLEQKKGKGGREKEKARDL